MLLDLVRLSRDTDEGKYFYESDKTLPRDRVSVLWFNLSDTLSVNREGDKVMLDGQFATIENIAIGQLFRHEKRVYKIVNKKASLVKLYKYTFEQADED